MTVVARMPTPFSRRHDVTETTQELQPGQSLRRLAWTGPGFAFCDKLNLPRVGGGLSHNQWQGCLGKLEQTASVEVSGDEQFPCDFRRVVLRSPDGLATLNAPASLSEIYCRKRGHRATRTQRVKRKRDGEKEDNIPLPEKNLFAHGPADRTCFTKLHGNQARNFCAASVCLQEGPSREYTDEREEAEGADPVCSGASLLPPSWKAPAPSPCEARAGRGLGRGASSIELARLIGIPSPLPSPHSSVVGRGNRPAAWWCQALRPYRVRSARFTKTPHPVSLPIRWGEGGLQAG